MIDVMLERYLADPVEPELVMALTTGAQACFDRHRVTWQGSLLAKDGHRLVCHFRAPDAEAARTGLRRAGADIRSLWTGTVHDAPGLEAADPLRANVLVERSFTQPVALEAIQRLEDAGSACLQNHRVRFVRTFFSQDGRRMICLYHAPDAESVRLAQRQAGMPLERAWSCQPILPPDHARYHPGS
ncbi:nickel-binding protein [Halomonas sp. C05BenzN]|uniref:nickel-binding protein n=1 Tax=Halomonas sp. C05BenzN TaxID=3411041 RepID=UPI003B931374